MMDRVMAQSVPDMTGLPLWISLVTGPRSAYSVCARSSARRWMSAHRAPASGAFIAPGDSATLIASCRAEPFAYASMSLDCRPADAADRRRAERAINAIRVTSTTTPSRIHSQRRLLLPDPAAGEAETADDVVAAVGVGVTVDVAVRLGRLLIALCTELPHPATRHPAPRMATGRARAFAEHRMSILPRRSWQPL